MNVDGLDATTRRYGTQRRIFHTGANVPDDIEKTPVFDRAVDAPKFE